MATRPGVTIINTPRIFARAEHKVSRANISEYALKVLYRLKEAGYASLLVGGCVRDLLLGREPKDFDVVTDVRPEQIREVFRSARLVGRRFRLAHVRFGRDIIEVATFRRSGVSDVSREPLDLEDEEEGNGEGNVREREETDKDLILDEDGRLLRDNVYGNQEEDAYRRDFTVNALYYDIRDFSIVDYVGGMEDLQAGIIRCIGEPEVRYREDPVRMLRAIRFAAKLGFRVEKQTAAPIRELASLLASVPPARLFEEVLKLFHGGSALETFELLRQYGLFGYLFPMTEQNLAQEEDGFPHTLVPRALANTDKRVNADKPVTPAFLFAAMLWEPVREETALLVANGMSPIDAQQRAADRVLRDQLKHIMLPKRFSVPMREIWSMQGRFERRSGAQAFRLAEHKRFRAAYDFLLLRAEVGETGMELADWWTRFQEVSPEERQAMVHGLSPEPGSSGQGKRRRRRRRRG
ncbi:MAG: poly(A) polymerase, partial [Candidatus Muproteobacteria bacterium RBG_16_62_13]